MVGWSLFLGHEETGGEDQSGRTEQNQDAHFIVANKQRGQEQSEEKCIFQSHTSVTYFIQLDPAF